MDNFPLIIFLYLCGCTIGLAKSQQCGVPVPHGKIVGGVDSGGYHYPWFALLLLKKNAYLPIPVCAGSLISNLFVLTAAHCFTIHLSVEFPDFYNVALGVYDICDDKEQTRQIFNMAAVAVHEKYQNNGKFYDIALIKLDKPALYVTICLPIPGVPDITEAALIIGFGVTGEDSNMTPCHLLEVNVTKYSKKDCLNTKLPVEDKMETSVICAGSLSGNADSCYGDSGGPLLTRRPDGRYILAGIISYGYGCGVPEVPGVYTNVGSYLRWISNKMSALGSKTTTKGTKKENPEVNIQRPRRPITGVLFPGNSSSFQPTRTRTPKINHTIVYFNEDHREIKPPKKTTKNSRVIFPN